MNRRNFLTTLISAAGLPFLIKDKQSEAKKYFKYEAGKSQIVSGNPTLTRKYKTENFNAISIFITNPASKYYKNYSIIERTFVWLGVEQTNYYLKSNSGNIIQTTEEVWNIIKKEHGIT